MDEVLKSARPLADMLWMRETEARRFDTPERRAALEARLGEITGAIGHEVGAEILPAGFRGAGARAVHAGAAAGGFQRGRRFEQRNRRVRRTR